MLADQGADVWKLEPPVGDQVRAMSASMSSTFAIVNRNKRSVAVDAKTPEGLAVIKRLVLRSDVFVQNFRPGAAERMGLSFDELRLIKPDLIYVSISGFGDSGPYSTKRVYDPVIQAVSGLATLQADDAGRPKMMRLIIPDKLTGVKAAQAITAALLQRTRTGRGQHVKISMLDTVVAFLWAEGCLLYTSPSPRDRTRSRMPSSA
eukprot:TRINITY_DN14052_c0_g1_i3.p1 TRINITY_DN14052_c0_g1~~TRINITY_DN14052_c0_g1_i3.p1  ORF type:complete len:205 (-),score=45.90 TRINITY_DN14052_c0_g1_i3:26-640(-)